MFLNNKNKNRYKHIQTDRLNGDIAVIKPGAWVLIDVDGANIQIVPFFTTVISRRKKSIIHSVTVTFGANYLTGMVTSVPPYETFSLIKTIFFVTLKSAKIKSKIHISEVCDL